MGALGRRGRWSILGEKGDTEPTESQNPVETPLVLRRSIERSGSENEQKKSENEEQYAWGGGAGGGGRVRETKSKES